MWQILIGSLILSIVHASIPNHWLPLVALGKTEKWSMHRTLTATGIAGTAHILSTILIGILVGFIGFKISSTFSEIGEIIGPTILIALGIVYLMIDLFRKNHTHNHLNPEVLDSKFKSKSKTSVILWLSLAMFLSPCAELEVYYFQAGTQGWKGILLVSIVYAIATVSFMIVLVYLGLRGVQKLKSHFLEHHEKRITGIFLIILGITAYFIEI
ncbi:MAG: hypothetical protein HC906_01280 [Bacteroidales bacterium]|nr:hypothetical protein [Bacteroidales bacterium]